MKKTLLLGLIAIMLLAACNKDKGKDPTLLGKWTLVNIVYKEYVGGTLVYSSDDPGNGATVEFQDNGSAVFKEGSLSQTVSYSIKPGSKVDIDGDVYDIQGLTDTNVTLHLRTDSGAGTYDDEIINLKR